MKIENLETFRFNNETEFQSFYIQFNHFFKNDELIFENSINYRNIIYDIYKHTINGKLYALSLPNFPFHKGFFLELTKVNYHTRNLTKYENKNGKSNQSIIVSFIIILIIYLFFKLF